SVIFYILHLSLLLEIADTVDIMYAGRIVEMVTLNDLLRHPRHPYASGLLHSLPPLHGPRHSLTGIAGSPPDLRSVPPGCAFQPRCAFAFAACRTIVPSLLPVASEGAEVPPAGEGQGTCVACHLYDAELNPEGPPESLES